MVSKKPDASKYPGVEEWERGLDPWHADAFVGTPAEGMFDASVPRKTGWYALDWCGNVIGFVPDEEATH